MGKKSKKPTDDNTIAVNRKARFDYTIEKHIEAGLVLEGWEVKSARAKKVQLVDSHAIARKGEIWLLNALFVPLETTAKISHPESRRTRKLLLHKKEIKQVMSYLEQRGYTLIPLKLYWKRNRIKLSLGFAKGKKLHDKRAASKDRDWERQRARILKKQ